MRPKPLTVSILANLLLIVAMFGCTAGFLNGIDKQVEINERVELTRCQEGYTAACTKWKHLTLAKE